MISVEMCTNLRWIFVFLDSFEDDHFYGAILTSGWPLSSPTENKSFEGLDLPPFGIAKISKAPVTETRPLGKSGLLMRMVGSEIVQKEEDDADKNNGKGKKTPNNEKFKEFDKK